MKKIIFFVLFILNFVYAEEDIKQLFADFVKKEDSLALDSNWDNLETFNVSILNQGFFHNYDYGKNICLLMNNKRYKLIFEEKQDILIVVTDMLSKNILTTYNCKKI